MVAASASIGKSGAPEVSEAQTRDPCRSWAASGRTGSLGFVPKVLLATDADWILDEVDAALSDDDTTVFRVRQGIDVLQAIDQLEPDLVILDEQIGNMGGIATCMAIRNAEGVDRIPITAVMLLLDRAHDVFLARRCEADGFVVKPINTLRLRRAATALLAGDGYEDPLDQITGQPAPTL
jgi:DNA-binding response OmpR family regulator